MAKLRPFIRYVLLTLFVGAVLTMFYGVVGEFFIEWARESGWYESPSRRVEVTMSAVRELVTQTWFLMFFNGIAGLTIGAWIDYLLRRRLPSAGDSKLALAVPFDSALYTYDPANEAPDRNAYYDLMDFTLTYVLSACNARIDLQKAIIEYLSKSKK